MVTYILIFVTAVISIVCFRNKRLFDLFSLKPYRIVRNKEWWRIITHGFVHGDYMHLIVNMFVLFSFGQFIEAVFKAFQQAGTLSNAHLSYLLLYFGEMIAASVYDMVKQHNNPYYTSIGASGAVSAVVFTSIFLAPWQKIYFFGVLPIPGIIFGFLYVLYSQYMGKREGDNINHFAHLYGGLFGFVFPILIDPSFFSIFLENITNPSW